MASHISTVAARDKLKARHEPYFVKLSVGCYLGFQKLTNSSMGTWVARYRSEETGRQVKRSLGPFDMEIGSRRYDAAKLEAEKWFRHLGAGGSTESVTVRQACERYALHVRSVRGDKSADDLEMRFKRWVFSDGLASVELTKLTKMKVENWRRALAATPAKVNRDRRPEAVVRARSASSVNRDMTALRAALNYAHDSAWVTSDMAWRVALRPAMHADGRRNVYLEKDERRVLIRTAPSDLAEFLEALCLVPLRPGALASLQCRAFDARLGVLTVGKDKAGRDRRIKLPAATASFFDQHTKDRGGDQPLFARVDGKAWDKDAWKGPMKRAVLEAGLPPNATVYTLRLSVITDLVTGGLDLLTVAVLSGTSVSMIERHYGHLRRSRSNRTCRPCPLTRLASHQYPEALRSFAEQACGQPAAGLVL